MLFDAETSLQRLNTYVLQKASVEGKSMDYRDELEELKAKIEIEKQQTEGLIEANINLADKLT